MIFWTKSLNINSIIKLLLSGSQSNGRLKCLDLLKMLPAGERVNFRKQEKRKPRGDWYKAKSLWPLVEKYYQLYRCKNFITLKIKWWQLTQEGQFCTSYQVKSSKCPMVQSCHYINFLSLMLQRKRLQFIFINFTWTLERCLRFL